MKCYSRLIGNFSFTSWQSSCRLNCPGASLHPNSATLPRCRLQILSWSVCPYSEWTYAHCPPLRSRRLNASQLFASIFAKCTLHDCAVSSTNRLYVNRMCTHLRRHPFVPHDCWHTVRMKCRLSPSQPESCASRQQCVYQSRPPPPPLPSSVPFAAVLPFDAAISSICACATHGAHPMKCRYFEPSTPSTQPLLGTEYRTLFAFFMYVFLCRVKAVLMRVCCTEGGATKRGADRHVLN
jgi:hypothetical protein